MELLNRIFYAVSMDSELIEPEMDLREFYHEIEGVRKSRSHFQNVLSCTELSEKQTLPIWNVWSSSCLTHERQGFVNGFRLGMMLSQELKKTEEAEY